MFLTYLHLSDIRMEFFVGTIFYLMWLYVYQATMHIVMHYGS